ncbi:MAG: permease [Candidatus Competibacteraceae bacterium]|nr:permease [Candidatus Competibacteraceae bacterium]
MATLKLALNDWPQRALRIDRVWLTIAVLFAGLALLNPIQAGSSVEFTLQALWDVLPFLLLSIAIAAYAKASGADNLIARAFQGRALPMITFAAVMGALSPFCSCGVIPLIAALLAMGVPLAPVMAFWLASPLMDPSMFVLTIGTLGTEFALAKTLAAFSIGLFGGFGIWLIQRNGGFSDPLREGIGDGGCGGAKVRKPKAVVWSFWQDSERRRSFLEGARDNLLFLGKWLTLAFVLESLMVAYIPAEWVAQAVGGEGLLPVISAALVGIPAYLNGYAALPLVGGLVEQGMAPGAGLAFLLAGGVTCIPAAIAVYALTRLPVFFAYLGFAFTGAVTAGLLFGLVA